jgi:hypothetical protein
MKIRTALVTLFAALGIMLATGYADNVKSYQINLSNAAVVGATQLKPGDYKVVVGEPKIRFIHLKSGDAVEVDGKVSAVEGKVPYTTVHSKQVDGVTKITEIRLGGSKTSVVFQD